MSRFFDRLGHCPLCAIIFWAALMTCVYCALAWWALSGPTPPIEPHEKGVGAPFVSE